ncbi:MAG TPA: lytic transglycosylase domain-containing protein [Mycobacteriales bacterium]|nr:lytic transglycosylase domain-containing protein [Mycobacteriales bacterium]
MALALMATLFPLATGSAHAATGGDPSATAAQLLAKVQRLQAKVNVAERKYARSFTTVTQSVSRAISADQVSSAVQVQAASAQTELLDRVRGLYESGGPLAAYAQFLGTGDITSSLDRTMLASRVVSAQVADVRDVQREALAAQHAASRAEHNEHVHIATVAVINRAASRVGALLAQQKSLLASADQALAAVQQAESTLHQQTAHFTSIGNTAAATTSGLRILPPSEEFLSLYQSAASYCPGLSWTILAAIGQVESGHGRNDGPSYAGAMGPMQFEPATFEAYGIDGDRDGVKNIDDPADAIYSAANYLCANGAGHGGTALYNAIWHYNHADWYVNMVETLAGLYATAYA